MVLPLLEFQVFQTRFFGQKKPQSDKQKKNILVFEDKLILQVQYDWYGFFDQP